MSGKKKSDNEQLEWMLNGTRSREGRVERRVRLAIAAGKKEPDWSAMFDGLAVAAVATARAMDRAESIKPDPYALAQAGRELREQLRELRLTPASRLVTDVDPEDEALRRLFEEDDEATTAS